jgi:hypothetical protein
MHTKVQLENLHGRDYLGDLDIDRQIILKLILKEYIVRTTGFM